MEKKNEKLKEEQNKTKNKNKQSKDMRGSCQYHVKVDTESN